MLADTLGEPRTREKGLGRSCGCTSDADRGGRRSSMTLPAHQGTDTHVNIYLEPFLNLPKGREFKLPTEVNGNAIKTLRKRGPLWG